MLTNAIKTGALQNFEQRSFLTSHNVRRITTASTLLQWNNCLYTRIYIAALFDEISSRNNKNERNDNNFTFRSLHVLIDCTLTGRKY